MVGKICRKGKFWAWRGRVKGWWMMRVVSQWSGWRKCHSKEMGEAELERLVRGWRRGAGSWFQRRGEAYWKERSVIRKEDVVGGRASMTKDEERVLRIITKPRICVLSVFDLNGSIGCGETWKRISQYWSGCISRGFRHDGRWIERHGGWDWTMDLMEADAWRV